jgi:hypothetical protein
MQIVIAQRRHTPAISLFNLPRKSYHSARVFDPSLYHLALDCRIITLVSPLGPSPRSPQVTPRTAAEPPSYHAILEPSQSHHRVLPRVSKPTVLLRFTFSLPRFAPRYARITLPRGLAGGLGAF